MPDNFDNQIEDSGQQDSTKPPLYPNEPYEVGDEEMSELNRGGPATDDQMVELDDPANPNPDDQNTRHLEGPTQHVADVETKEWEDRVAAEQRDQELEATDQGNPTNPNL